MHADELSVFVEDRFAGVFGVERERMADGEQVGGAVEPQ